MPGLIDQEPTGKRPEAQKRLNTTFAQFALHNLLRQTEEDAAISLDMIGDKEILAAVAKAAETLARMCRERIER